MKTASLLRETMWSMVSEITSKLDFDYSEYTQENLSKFIEAFESL
jgi:thiamine kinase-like enzyme